ncbi:MAG TPA: PAS domain S-box protein [Pyrinomonadaceae bacterium]|nr:PAS domain S-box protein [Pyrinomonadaceae bacterium]
MEKVRAVSATGSESSVAEDGSLFRELLDSRRAALNLMEDAVEAREQAERVTRALQTIAISQAILLQVNDVIRGLADPAAMQTAAMNILGAHLRVNRAFYSDSLDDEDTLITGPGYFKGVPELESRMKISDFNETFRTELRAGRTVVVDDVLNNPDLKLEPFNAISARSGIGVPLLKDGRLVAVMGIHQSKPRAWKKEEVSLVEEVAQRTWQATERARAEIALRESETRLAEELADVKQLQEISATIIREEKVDFLFEKILDAAKNLMQADMASIQMHDPDAGGLRLIASIGFHPESAKFWEVVRDHTGAACGMAAAQRKRIVVADIEKCDFIEGTDDLKYYRLSGIRSVQSLPLISRSGSIVGVISTQWREVTEPPERSLKVLEVLARQAADFIERIRSEESLRASEEKFRLLSEAAPALIWFDDADGNCVSVNRRYVEFSGRSPKDLAGDGWQLVLHEDDVDGYTGEFKNAQSEQRAFHARVRARRYDGSWRWIESYAQPLFGRDGTFLGHVGVSPDVTDTVEAEAQMRHNSQLFLGLIESAPFGVYLVDSNFRLAQVSRAAQKVFANVDPLIGRDFAEVMQTIWQEPFASEAIARFRHTLETGEPYRSEDTTEPRGDVDAVESYDWQLRRITLPDGTFGVVCYFFDMTDRRRAEAALRYSEERLRLLTESFQDIAIFTANTAGEVVTWNPGAEKIFGYSYSEIVGGDAKVLFIPEDQASGEHLKEMQTAKKRGRAADERWHQRKDGSRFYASGIMAPLYDGDRLVGYAKIARDLTRQKQAEDELLRQYDELESIVAGRTAELAEANDALRHQMEKQKVMEDERFALLQKVVTTQEDERRRIARDMHDSLGQQLTALRLKLASLKQDHSRDDKLGEHIEKLQELGANLDSEVNFLVWELRPTVLDDLGLVAAIEDFSREWSRHYGIPAEIHTGRFAQRRLMPNVETNLYRILQEALNNVYKHSRAKTANIVLESRRGEVVLIIEDDGVGFDPDAMKANPDSSRGFGLIGMRERAGIIGGRVEIESSPGQGTTVFARVPATKGE